MKDSPMRDAANDRSANPLARPLLRPLLRHCAIFALGVATGVLSWHESHVFDPTWNALAMPPGATDEIPARLSVAPAILSTTGQGWQGFLRIVNSGFVPLRVDAVNFQPASGDPAGVSPEIARNDCVAPLSPGQGCIVTLRSSLHGGRAIALISASMPDAADGKPGDVVSVSSFGLVTWAAPPPGIETDPLPAFRSGANLSGANPSGAHSGSGLQSGLQSGGVQIDVVRRSPGRAVIRINRGPPLAVRSSDPVMIDGQYWTVHITHDGLWIENAEGVRVVVQ